MRAWPIIFIALLTASTLAQTPALAAFSPNSGRLQATTCYSNFTPVLTTTRTWDCGFRLASIVNGVNGSTVTSHAYAYDAVNRRTRATLEDGSHWNYGYNDRNELTGASRQWPDTQPVAGQQFSYAYDTLGPTVRRSDSQVPPARQLALSFP